MQYVYRGILNLTLGFIGRDKTVCHLCDVAEYYGLTINVQETRYRFKSEYQIIVYGERNTLVQFKNSVKKVFGFTVDIPSQDNVWRTYII